MKNEFEVQYKDVMTGEIFNYKISSEFIADKLISNILSFSRKNKIPIYKTKLKIIKRGLNFTQLVIAIDSLEDSLVSFKLYHN